MSIKENKKKPSEFAFIELYFYNSHSFSEKIFLNF